MRSFASSTHALGALAAVAIVAGCSGGASQAESNSLTLTRDAFLPTAGRGVRPAEHNEFVKSWVAPDAKRKDLLYVSDDVSNNVYIYSYPGGSLEGALTGFTVPTGLCVDKAGDVFVSNFGDGNIVEYAHGGTKPIATLGDPGQIPESCAVDPKTGNLAVLNHYGYQSSTNGNVIIYKKATGSPKMYADPNFYYYYFCGYDSNGNLFIDGATSYSNFELAELPHGHKTFRDIALNQLITNPGAVEWDGKYLAVGDQGWGQAVPEIYRFRINGSKGLLQGSTELSGSAQTAQFWIDGKRVVGANASSNPSVANGSGSVMFWKFPIGGTATKTILVEVTRPFGVAISKGKK